MTHQNSSGKIDFVGLHAHSCASVFDGLGYPEEHINFAFENGSKALALTDHGTMNGLVYQINHAKKMNKEGKSFKPLFGVEAYYNPSISKWKQLKLEIEEEKKSSKKKNDKNQVDEAVGTLIENESETKTKKNPLRRYSHMVLLAQNENGLKNIFKLISSSFQEDNFYRFPRIDLELLKQYNSDIIALSACAGGIYGTDYWENKDKSQEEILNAMRKTTESMLSVFGKRWYAELQWNAIEEQHKINKFVIQIAKEFNIDLVSTADSHYPRPELWKDRILYKKLAWMDYKSTEPQSLPSSVDEIGYELYPKNGPQMYEAYKRYSSMLNQEYDDDLVLDSIERTHDIAFNKISSFYPDTGVKLPSFVVPEGENENKVLRDKCFYNLSLMGIDNPLYRQRLEQELNVIARNGFSKYFLTMEKIHEIASKKCLTSAGRGSAAGSLISFILGITQADPVKYGLLFERFLMVPEPSGFVNNNKNENSIKTKVNKLVKIEFESGKTIYVTEDVAKNLMNAK